LIQLANDQSQHRYADGFLAPLSVLSSQPLQHKTNFVQRSFRLNPPMKNQKLQVFENDEATVPKQPSVPHASQSE